MASDDSSGDSSPGRPGQGAVAAAQAAAAPPGVALESPGLDSEPPLAGRRFRTFDSLIDVPAFRWYMLSQVGNQSAQLMQMVVRGFLAYQITGSFTALGIVELANSVPRVFLALYGGVVADRASRRVIIQTGQALNTLLALVLAALLFAELLRFEHLLFAAMAQGVMNSFVMPARQSMIPEIVGTARLMNAFALNTFGMNVLRLGAPALAGVLIATVGSAWVFVVMAALFLFALVTLFAIPQTNATTRAIASGVTAGVRRGSRLGLREIAEALAYLRTQRLLCALLAMQCAISILSLPYQRLLPGFVDRVLSGGDPRLTAGLMGALLSFTAIGALVGSLLIASLPSRRRGLLMIASLAIFAVGLLAFSFSTHFWLSAAIVLVLGIGQAGRQSLVQILIQSHTADAFRGRVSSILLLEDGIESLGIFLIAMLAQAVGPQLALGLVAITLGLFAAGTFASRSIRELE